MTSINRNTSKGKDANVCILCNSNENNELKYGKIFSNSRIKCHYYCLLFASGLSQNGNDNDGFYGFLESDIRKEVKRGEKLSCSFCRKKGATIGCVIKTCKTKCHLPCGVNHKDPVLHQFFGKFETFCYTHRPSQNIKLLLNDDTCSVCADSKTSHGESPHHVLHTPCCKRWIHRLCVQSTAINAGIHFMKCCFCNDKSKFNREMKRMGIYIPDQDASWENDNAFTDQLERHKHCDSERCLCKNGRNYDGSGTRGDKLWKLLICRLCASQGTHVKCANISEAINSWTCDTCANVDLNVERNRKRNSEHPQPMQKKRSRNSIRDLIIESRNRIENDERNGQRIRTIIEDTNDKRDIFEHHESKEENARNTLEHATQTLLIDLDEETNDDVEFISSGRGAPLVYDLSSSDESDVMELPIVID